MNIQFPGPSEPSFGSSSGGQSSQQIQADLSQIQEIDQEIEEAMASGESPSQIQSLTQLLQAPLQNLASLSSLLTPSQTSVLKTALTQYQNEIQNGNGITPANIAIFQGDMDTLSQLISLPPQTRVNIQALEAQNQLSELGNALEIQLEAKNSPESSDCSNLIQAMNSPLSVLQGLALGHGLTPSESQIVSNLLTLYQDFKNPNTTTPETAAEFQGSLYDLNSLILKG